MANIELSAKLLNTAANQPLVDAEDVWNGSTPIMTEIGKKQDKISDLATIRKNAADAIKTETDPTVPAWAKAATKPTYTAAEVGALPSTTTIPSKTSQLTNDSGFLTAHQSLSGYATQSWVNTQGFIKAETDGTLNLTGYIKESDFIQKYAVVDVEVTSFSNTSLTGSYSITIAGKPVQFDAGTLSIKCGSASATISGNIFTFSGNLLNTSTNKVTFTIAGKVDGVSISVTSPSITAYAVPIKMGYLSSSNPSSTSLVTKYASTFEGINFDVANASNQNYLFLYVPKAMYNDFGIASKLVQVQDRKSPINTVALDKQDITLTDYYVYKLDSTQKVGDYKWQTKLI